MLGDWAKVITVNNWTLHITIRISFSLHAHSVLSKINWSRFKCVLGCLKEDQDGKLKLVKKPLFEIPLSIMDIWYTQALMW